MVHDATLALLIVVKSDCDTWCEDRMRWCGRTCYLEPIEVCISVQSLSVTQCATSPFRNVASQTTPSLDDRISFGVGLQCEPGVKLKARIDGRTQKSVAVTQR